MFGRPSDKLGNIIQKFQRCEKKLHCFTLTKPPIHRVSFLASHDPTDLPTVPLSSAVFFFFLLSFSSYVPCPYVPCPVRPTTYPAVKTLGSLISPRDDQLTSNPGPG